MFSVLRKAFFNLLFPQTCAMCGCYVGEDGACVCDDCMRRLPRTEQAFKSQNVTEMVLADSTSDMVRAAHQLHLYRAAAFMFYEKEHPVQKMIHAMKYGSRPEVGYLLGQQAATEFGASDFFDGIDIIVPMPLHPNRMRKRGYNQSEYIARGISSVTGIPVDTTHVTRIKDTPQQALLHGKDRIVNVADAFAVNHPEQMYHKHILLVDDLITTGETAKACLKAMKVFRGATFSVFALCKPR